MTSIKPFQAVIYNQEKIKNLSKVICPPYDVISPEAQQRYHDLDEYNFIHILLGRDIQGEDKYQRSGVIFHEWLKNKILIQDERPSIYFYSHQYLIKGEKKIRLGFIALLRLGKAGSPVFPHEHTRLEAKEDRAKLLRQVKANLSPIFVVFPDEKRIIQRTYQNVFAQKPLIDVIDEDRACHKVWRINNPEMLETIRLSMVDENIFIADGHHRYEVACAYQEEMRQESGVSNEEESFNFILSYFTNTESRGLTILPIHRLLKLKENIDWAKISSGLGDYFELEEVKDKRRFFFMMEKSGRSEHVLGAYVHGSYWLLRLRNVKILDKLINDRPREYRSLDVSILNYIVLKRVLGVNWEDKQAITFNPHAEELIAQVDRDPSFIAFFLNPVKVEQIMSVALGGNRMPPKSTYFYPKVASGLVINKLD